VDVADYRGYLNVQGTTAYFKRPLEKIFRSGMCFAGDACNYLVLGKGRSVKTISMIDQHK
jgi:hypothetical protein